MRMCAPYIAAALCILFGPAANASIVGSTYDFTTSVTGVTTISPLGGPTLHTDPANPSFFVGPGIGGGGITGFIGFANVSPTLDTITFTYFGSTTGGTGSFTIDLGHFVTLDGEVITGVSLASNGLVGATPSVSFNGTDALFKQSTTTSFNAIGGKTAVFDVTTAATPLPAALPLFATGIGALGLLGWRRKRKARAAA